MKITTENTETKKNLLRSTHLFIGKPILSNLLNVLPKIHSPITNSYKIHWKDLSVFQIICLEIFCFSKIYLNFLEIIFLLLSHYKERKIYLQIVLKWKLYILMPWVLSQETLGKLYTVYLNGLSWELKRT